MKPLYTVEYRKFTNPTEIITKTVTIEAQGAGQYWLKDISTEKSFLIGKDRVVAMRKHGVVDNAVEV